MLVLVGVLAACGSSAKEATPTSDSSGSAEQTGDQPTEPATEPEAETAAPTTDGEVDQPIEPADDDDNPADDLGNDVRIENGDDDLVTIDDLDQLPAECRQIMGNFLREIEPIVTAVDWENATMGDLETFDTDFAEPSDRLDAAMEASGCDRFEFGPATDDGMAFTIELAQTDAPGVISWLEFIRDLGNLTGTALDVPTDCEGAIAFMSDLIAGSSGISESPLTQLPGVTSVMSTIQSECPPEQATAFFEDPALMAWSEN